MAQPQHTPYLAHLEGALTVLFCLTDDAYAMIDPRAESHESIKRLSDSEVIALAMFSSSSEGWRASARSCATRGGSSRTCSRG